VSRLHEPYSRTHSSCNPVIDEEALVRALKSKKVLRAGLDVFEHEPNPHPYLLQSERVTVLPVGSHQCSPNYETDILSSTGRQLRLDYKWIENMRSWVT
jgi:hypothetical protein